VFQQAIQKIKVALFMHYGVLVIKNVINFIHSSTQWKFHTLRAILFDFT